MQILGVRVDNISVLEALQKIGGFFSDEKKHYIFTPNPEMIVKSKTDVFFRDILNQGDINLCDGFGIRLVAFLRGKSMRRVTGVDFMMELCRWCSAEYKSVYLLGGLESDTAKKTMQILRDEFPGLKIVGAEAGLEMLDSQNNLPKYDSTSNNKLIERISDARPDVIFVAFGMGKQEKWLVENMPKITKVKIGMGVGGAFDYISGKVPRAPLLMRKFGLEWVYRFFKQPQRFKRIFNATIKFLFLVFREK